MAQAVFASWMLLGLSCQTGLVAGEAAGASPNPVSGVIKLMSRLQAQVMEEGKAEASAYDKFACFCKEQSDEKLYSITKKSARIDELAATIKKLEAGIEDFTRKEQEASKAKAGLQKQSEEAIEQRNKDYVDYVNTREDRLQAIEEIVNATKAVKESKAEGSLIQISKHNATMNSSSVASKVVTSASAKPKEYGFKGDDTLKKLEELHDKFKADLKQTEEKEAESKHQHNLEEAARQREITSQSSLITKCQDVVGQKSKLKSDAEKDKTELEDDKADDQAFMEKLTEECEEKAEKWDARSKRRANELTAMSQALAILKGAKLGLVAGTVKVQSGHGHNGNSKHGHWVWKSDAKNLKKNSTGPSLMQVNNVPAKETAHDKVVSHLAKQASMLHSTTLYTFVMELKANPFNSVKKMIKNLIKKIDDDQASENDEIADCKTDITDNTRKRAKNSAKIESEQAKIMELAAKIDDHQGDIEEVQAGIAEMYQALSEATELRAQEKKSNAKTIAEAEAGKRAMEGALKVLEDFYQSSFDAGLIQKGHEEPELGAPDSEKFLGSEGGADPSKQGESQGVLALLGTLKDDYDQTALMTETEDEAAETEFLALKKKIEDDTAEKESVKKELEGKVRTATSDTEQTKEDLAEWTEQKGEAENELNILKPRCLALGAAAEEREKRRQEEKKSLSDAMVILDSMGPAPEPKFLQVKSGSQ